MGAPMFYHIFLTCSCFLFFVCLIFLVFFFLNFFLLGAHGAPWGTPGAPDFFARARAGGRGSREKIWDPMGPHMGPPMGPHGPQFFFRLLPPVLFSAFGPGSFFGFRPPVLFSAGCFRGLLVIGVAAGRDCARAILFMPQSFMLQLHTWMQLTVPLCC